MTRLDEPDETEREIEAALAALIEAGEIELTGMDSQGRAVYRRAASEGGWCTVVFMDGEEGREVVHRLTNTDGVLVMGATEETIQETAEYLALWDYGEDHSLSDSEPWGRYDDTAEVTVSGTDYILAWNTGLGYVSLQRHGGAS